MTSLAELAHTIATWAHDPDPTLIQATLTDSPDRYSLATLYVTSEHPIPEELHDLLRDLLLTDPLTTRIFDTIYTEVIKDEGPNIEKITTLIEPILLRVDSDAFQLLLADDLLDELTEDNPEPPRVARHLAQAAAALAAGLPSPDFAPILFIYAASDPTPEDLPGLLQDCWNRAIQLPDPLTFLLAGDICGLIDTDSDEDLARAVEEHALAIAHTLTDADEDTLSALHMMHAELIAHTDIPAAIDYIDDVLTAHPGLESTPLAAAWFFLLRDHIIRLMQSEPPAEQLLTLADTLEGQAQRWPADDPPEIALAALALTRIYIAASQPSRAQPWAERAWENPHDDHDFQAEVSMLRVHIAHQQGRSGEISRLLREAAPSVQQALTDDYRAQWSMFANIHAQANSDESLADLTSRGFTAAASSPTADAFSYQDDDVRQSMTAYETLMQIRRRILTGTAAPGDLDRALALAHRDSANNGERLGALLLAAHAYASSGETGHASAVLQELDELLQEEHLHPSTTVSIGAIDALRTLLRSARPLEQDGPDSATGEDLLAARDDCERNDQPHFAYMLTRALMILHTRRGDHHAALAEGIRGLRFHTRRAVTLPDARERASMRSDFHVLAQETIRSAQLTGQNHVVAEILEVLRAQPVPTSRTDVPVVEQSLARLATDLLEEVTTSTLPAWNRRWSADSAGTPAMAEPQLVDTELVLTGLPSLRMPWGLALDDQLRDPHVNLEARVWVPRVCPNSGASGA